MMLHGGLTLAVRGEVEPLVCPGHKGTVLAGYYRVKTNGIGIRFGV